MKKTSSVFYSIVGLFFFWGFVAASNDVLIPIFKDHLHIEQWQSQMISFVFYFAYTVGSILYLLISFYLKNDLLQVTGYSKGLSIGLLISFIGTFLFIPAAQSSSFIALITGLFIIGLGFSLQQTAANPIVINAGDVSFGSQRLSLAGGINNIGTTIGPLIVSYAVFKNSTQLSSIEHLMYPYLILGAMFIIIAVIFFFQKMKFDFNAETQSIQQFSEITSLIKQPQVWMGMLAIFTYVGVEVSTAANFAEFAKQKANISTSEVAPYISLYWGCLMIGRWASAADIFAESKWKKSLLKIIFPLLAYSLINIILLVNHKSIPNIEWMLAYIVVMVILDYLSKGDAARQLTYYSIAGFTLIGLGIITQSTFSIFNILAVGLFCSTLWPCIFEIALYKMGKNTGIVSSLLIMMIMGGGWISVFQAYLSKPFGINLSYVVGMLCFAYLCVYGVVANKKKQLINV
jgi:FHS family L-fucose permease-like MFS transporter